MKIRLHFFFVIILVLMLVIELTSAGYKGDHKQKHKGNYPKGVEGNSKEAKHRYTREPRQKEVKYKKSKRSVEDYDLKLVDGEEQHPEFFEENTKRRPTVRTTITSKLNKKKSAQKQHQHTKHEQRDQENIQTNPVEEEYVKDVDLSPRRKMKNEKTKAYIEQQAEELEEIELDQEEPFLRGPEGIQQEEVQEAEEQFEEEEIYYVISSSEKPSKKKRKRCYYE